MTVLEVWNIYAGHEVHCACDVNDPFDLLLRDYRKKAGASADMCRCRHELHGAGALDPQYASAASEELKVALLKQGVLRTLAELAASCAERLSRAPKGEAARYALLPPMLSHASKTA